VRLILSVLLLTIIGMPPRLAAQASETPQAGASAIQPGSNPSTAPNFQIFSARRVDVAAPLDVQHTAQLLASISFPKNPGQYALLGANEDNKASATVSSGDPSLTSAIRATTAFRPASEMQEPSLRLWTSFAIIGHGAAVFDAWSTRDIIQNSGAHELNPLFRPFAGSNLIYAATQVGPGLFDYLGYRMMKSKRSWARKWWWLPQLVGTAASLLSGAHNLAVAQGRPTTAAP
jgi:hypothetical protein